ncbi:MAG: glycosyltransferase family 39 protein [Magnetococcales bacterium]|nr:glycosyltransferase family 39 protein [Magnetococcales bacterium]
MKLIPLPWSLSAFRRGESGDPSGWLLGLLVLAWLLPGLVGHDPWKPDEGYSMGLIYHIMESGDWVVPTLGGEPFMEKPPIYYITAAQLAHFFSPWLPLHDGARLTSGFYMAIVLLCVALTGRELYGKGNGRISLLLLLGAIGLVPHAHQMITDTALLAGFAMALYGLALTGRRFLLGGGLLGLGTGLGFMAKGLLAPVILGGVVCVLLLFHDWRNRRFFYALAVALLVALPWLTLWPYLLYQYHPVQFDTWFWDNNYGRFFGSSELATRHDPSYYLQALTWFTGPGIPLALLALWQSRPSVAATTPGYPVQLPLVMASVVLFTLFASAAMRTLYILPFLLPIALLATPAVAGYRRQMPRWPGMLLITLFGGLLLLIWGVWLLVILQLVPPAFWQRVGVMSLPAGGTPWQGLAFAVAALASGAWIVGIRRMAPSARDLLTGWSSGVALVWLLWMTLWLPVIDHGKSYRSMVEGLKQAIPASSTCMASRALGEPQRALLHYFGPIFTHRLENGPADPPCDLLLVQSESATIHNPPADGVLLWRGGRPGDNKEWYALYQLRH